MALLWPGWHPNTSKKLKCGVGEFVRRCREERFCPLKFQEQRRKTPGSWEITRPLGDTSAPDSTQFCLAGLRQNAQGEGNAEGSIFMQDKRRVSQVTPARVTSPRSAGRFKGFRALERGRMRGSYSGLGAHFWGLILHRWPLLAALSGGHRGDTAHRPPSRIAPLKQRKGACGLHQCLQRKGPLAQQKKMCLN